MRAPLESSVPDYEQGSGPGFQRATDALRLWLTSGVHTLGVDRRRRAGSHSKVRELLVAERVSGGGWSETAFALRRHTLHAALAQLSALERSVVSLAYLEGQTNRQIAAALGVSVTTVRRRLLKALARLEAYIAASGAWLASILLLGLSVFARWTRADRLTESTAATVTTGVVAAAVIGIVVSAAPTLEAVHHGVPSARAGLPAAVASALGPDLLRSIETPTLAAGTADATTKAATDSTTTTGQGHNHGKRLALGHLKPSPPRGVGQPPAQAGPN